VVLGPSVLQHLLGHAGAAQRVNRTLGRRDGLARHGGHRGDRPGNGVGSTARRPGVGLAAELLDAPLDLASVTLGLSQVLLKALLVGRLRGHGDMSLERGLELLLLAVRLVQVLDQLRVPGVGIRHRSIASFRGLRLFAYPVDGVRNLGRGTVMT
jgi:hypothetical protein